MKNPDADAYARTEPRQATDETSQHTTRSYTQILRSTAVIGAASLINVGFSIIRIKAMAVLLGPQGIGLMALYGSIADLAQSIAGLGIQESGVRQIAEAVGSGDEDRIASTSSVLKRIAVVLGLLGAVLLTAFSFQISYFTFGDYQQTLGVALLSIAIFFRLVSSGQMALVQGMRRISDLGRINILGAFFSTAIGIPIIFYFGTDGIVPSLVAMACVGSLTSWWYSRKICVIAPPMTAQQFGQETAALLKLGIVFMASAILTTGAAFAIRSIVLRTDGVMAAGLYQSAWALGGLYAGFILQAMGADFYPRLTAIANDATQCNRLVNEQAQVSMLLAGPGVLATLTVAPLVISLFYTAEFHPAVNLLRWICLGMMLRMVAWPMGYIILARGAGQVYFLVELAAALVHVGLAWLLVDHIGVTGAGLAFFGLYVWHSVLIYFVVWRMTGFRLSVANLKLGLIFLPAAGIVFFTFFFLPALQATILGATVTLCCGIYSLRMLAKMLPATILPPALQRWLTLSPRTEA